MPNRSIQSVRSHIRTQQDARAIRENPSLKRTPENLPSYQADKKAQGKEFERLDKKAIQSRPYLKHMPASLPSSIKKLEQEESKQRLIKRRKNVSNFNKSNEGENSI